MLSLGPLAFAAPWALVALVALPALWLILRATPPAPREVVFAPIRLLQRLARTPEEPDSAPWWLIALRLAAAALVILALAQPVWRPEPSPEADAPLLVLIDDGWAAAGVWPRVTAEARGRIEAAGADGRRVALAFTAAARGEAEPAPFGSARDALARLDGHEPRPWGVDRGGSAGRLPEPPGGAGRVETVWISDGLAGPGDGDAALARALSGRGPLKVLTPPASAAPLALAPPRVSADGFEARVVRAEAGAARSAEVVGLGADGRAIARAEAVLEEGATSAAAAASLPLDLRNRLRQVRIEGEASAGAVQLLDDAWRRPRVGLIDPAGGSEPQPLLSDRHYVREALRPSAEVIAGSLAELLDADPSALVMTDAARAETPALSDWIEGGGVLIRFAGPRLAARGDRLTPVSLREGGRLFGGAMAWDAPQRLAPFPETSPFAGLDAPAEALVRRQVLAQPAPDLDAKTWARLSDGTPLVTAERRGEGYVVLFHVTASPDWSDLPLSGLFPSMLQRVTALSGGQAGAAKRQADGAWRLERMLSGDGRLVDPPADAEPIPAADWSLAFVSPATPPGLYRLGAATRALNVIGAESVLEPLARDLPGAVYERLDGARERRLGGWLLALAALIFAADAVVALALSGRLPGIGRGAGAGPGSGGAAALLLTAGLALSPPAEAQALSEAETLERSLETRFAYVETGEPEIDRIAALGLSGLSREVAFRSAIEPAPPRAVNIETDPILFFPLIYWPVTLDAPALSPQAAAKVEAYLQAGGLIVFDTRDGGAGWREGAHPGLARLLDTVDVPPLTETPADHVLTRTFYLLDTFPGRYAGGRVWVEADAAGSSRDGASGVVIGSADWASAWAVGEDGRALAPVEGGERQRELALRFGVNLAMYALTGNYKADQVHVPAILERLGRER